MTTRACPCLRWHRARAGGKIPGAQVPAVQGEAGRFPRLAVGRIHSQAFVYPHSLHFGVQTAPCLQRGGCRVRAGGRGPDGPLEAVLSGRPEAEVGREARAQERS